MRDIADARADLDQRDPDSPPASGSRRWLGWATAALMAFVLIALLASGATLGRQPNAPASDPGELQQLTLEAGVPTAPSLSADGRLLAYASKRSGRGDLDIWLQQMAGGSPIQITDDLHDDTDPDLSPDGTSVMFRSERDGGGAYTAASLGGPARLVAPEGRTPHWSPDGRTIAYWTGGFRGQVAQPTSVFILPLSGGAPTRLMADFEVARDPVWSPDGRALLVLALRTRPATAGQPLDWWYVPLDGSAPSRTGILDRVGWHDNMEQSRMTAGPWRESRFLLAIDGGLWSVPLTARGTLDASPRALVFGAGRVSKPTQSRDGDIVFAQQTIERVIERAPITTADAPLPVVRLVSDGNPDMRRTSVTRDGLTIVYENEAISGREIWRKDLRTGAAQLFLSVQSKTIVNPTISADGSLIAYVTDNGGEGLAATNAGTGYIVSLGGGVPRKLCEYCFIFELTADNRAVIIDARDGAIALIDIAKGTRFPVVLKPDTGTFDRATLSPDGRWMAFRRAAGQDLKSYLVPATGNASVASAEQIDEPTTSGRPAGWSPDSRVLYLLLDADGSRCLWGQRVDPANGRLLGKPYVARHFHELGGNVSSGFGSPVTGQGFVYETLATRSNLWRLIPPRQEPVK